MSDSKVTLDVVIRTANGVAAMGKMAGTFARAASAAEKVILELRFLSGWSEEDVLTELRTDPRSLSDLLFYYRRFNRFPSEVKGG